MTASETAGTIHSKSTWLCLKVFHSREPKFRLVICHHESMSQSSCVVLKRRWIQIRTNPWARETETQASADIPREKARRHRGKSGRQGQEGEQDCWCGGRARRRGGDVPDDTWGFFSLVLSFPWQCSVAWALKGLVGIPITRLYNSWFTSITLRRRRIFFKNCFCVKIRCPTHTHTHTSSDLRSIQ